jgi:hypothetical protein
MGPRITCRRYFAKKSSSANTRWRSIPLTTFGNNRTWAKKALAHPPAAKQERWFGQIAAWLITQLAMDAINGITQLAKRRAREFWNFSYLRTIAYLDAAKRKFSLPSLLPT